MIKAVLFDLDGTLLPMDNDYFVDSYMAILAEKFTAYGYDKKTFLAAIWKGIKTMFLNDGTRSNEACYWEGYNSIIPTDWRIDNDRFNEFYSTHFDEAKRFCSFNPLSKVVIDTLKKDGYKLALATNPVFPNVAVEKRVNWAGLEWNDFELLTTYDTERFCKPTEGYYRSIAERLGVAPEECLMVGNDVSDDMPAQKTGMKVFLLTDYLINRKNEDISVFPNGDFNDLLAYIRTL